MKRKRYFEGNMWLLALLVSCVRCSGDLSNSVETGGQGVDSVFSPSVSATCRAGVMNIKVETNNNFQGAVHARDYRRPACTNYGQGTSSTSLEINLLADQNTDKYCGVFVNKDNNERSVAIAVRIHKTLELADDKYYMITCGRAGFQNLEYKLRAHISQYDGSVGMRVRRCFSFSDLNTTVELVDQRGCPDRSIMSEFQYDGQAGTAEARLFSM